MLSEEEQEILLEAEGEEVLEIEFWECKAGDVFRARNKQGDIVLIELTAPISRRANIYCAKEGELPTGDSFCENCYILYPVEITEPVVFEGGYIPRIMNLKKVRST